MHHLLKVFFDILRLRQGPQALPTSGLLLGIVLVLHYLLGVALLSITLSFANALFGAFIGTGLTVVLVRVALLVRGLSHRFVQTTTAMAGCEFLLALATLPLATFTGQGDISVVATVISLLLVGWNVAISAHIFRHALNLSAWNGFAVALLYLFISYAVAGLFTGPGA